MAAMGLHRLYIRQPWDQSYIQKQIIKLPLELGSSQLNIVLRISLLCIGVIWIHADYFSPIKISVWPEAGTCKAFSSKWNYSLDHSNVIATSNYSEWSFKILSGPRSLWWCSYENAIITLFCIFSFCNEIILVIHSELLCSFLAFLYWALTYMRQSLIGFPVTKNRMILVSTRTLLSFTHSITALSCCMTRFH